MNEKERELLRKWITHVMYMLAANAYMFSAAEREELAMITGDLVEEMKRNDGVEE